MSRQKTNVAQPYEIPCPDFPVQISLTEKGEKTKKK